MSEQTNRSAPSLELIKKWIVKASQNCHAAGKKDSERLWQDAWLWLDKLESQNNKLLNACRHYLESGSGTKTDEVMRAAVKLAEEK
jgi:hypothetical protein